MTCVICKKEKVIKNEITCSNSCKSKLKNRTKVNCGECNTIIYAIASKIKKSKSGKLFCTNACVGKYNSKTRLQDIYNECVMCCSKFKVIKATKDSHITCSRKCQGEWQSKYRVGEKSSNYRGGSVTKVCLNCNIEYFTRYTKVTDKSKYCSINCKREYWKNNIIVTDEFKLAKLEGNLKHRFEGKETLPEKIVREYLDDNNIKFHKEYLFFNKYIVDYYLPETNTIIEVNGDYWHGNPEVYGMGKKELNNNQILQIEKDNNRRKEFIIKGYRFIELWEKDIYKDINFLMNQIEL